MFEFKFRCIKCSKNHLQNNLQYKKVVLIWKTKDCTATGLQETLINIKLILISKYSKIWYFFEQVIKKI